MGATFSLKIKNRKRIPADALNFLDPLPMAAAFNLTPTQALDYFRSKGLKPTFSYLDMMGQEHDYAFTVAGMMDADLLHDVRKAVDSAIATGQSMRDFEKELTPLLQKKGWWGDKELLDPLTGDWVPKSLGSPHRLELIFRTNLMNSYAAGQWEQIQRQKEIAPYLMYDAVDDHRTRPEHAQWDGKVLPVDSPFWQTHYGPNGYNCRCGVIQLDQDDLEEMGITPSAEPKLKMQPWTNPRTGKPGIVYEGLDPGWNKNTGIGRVEQIKQVQADKLQLFPPDMVAAIKKAQPAIEKARKRLQYSLKGYTTPVAASTAQTVVAATAGGTAGAAVISADETDALIDEWESAMMAGQEPSTEALAAFESLPQRAMDALLAEIERNKWG
jgi:SPP1 gp7 family putative phage head morphogenesis protein